MKDKKNNDLTDDQMRKRIEDLLGITKYKSIHKLIQLEKYKLADEELKKILQKNPDDFDALLLKGNMYMNQGRIGSAADIFENVIKLQPNEPRGHYFLGFILSEGLDKKKGIKELEKALELAPKDVEYMSSLAFALYQNKKKDRAEKLINDARKIDPNNDFVKKRYHLIFDEKTDSKKVIKDLLKTNAHDMESLNILGIAYLEEKKFKEAEKTFKRALAQEPGNPMLLNNVKVAIKAGNWFYKPKYYMNQWISKHGIIKFYLIYFALLFVAILTFPPLIVLILLYVIYSWVSELIGWLLIKNYEKKVRG